MLKEKTVTVAVCNYCFKEPDEEEVVYSDSREPFFMLCGTCVEKIIKVWRTDEKA